MAEVRLCCGRGAYDFAHKVYHRFPWKISNKPGKRAIQASTLSVGFLSGRLQSGGLSGAGNAAGSSGFLCFTTPALSAGRGIFGKGRSIFGRCLSLPHGQFVFIREYGDNGTRSEPLYKTKTGYYDILDVKSNATQAQIKTAYYKKSFVYHPDRNAGSEEATDRFSEINEAYTVLGSQALRKKYDRGLLGLSDLVAAGRPGTSSTTTAAGSAAKQQTERRRSSLAMDLKGGPGIFDFDKFYKSHYGEQLQRDRNLRSDRERMLAGEQQTPEMKLDNQLTMAFVLVLLSIAGVLIALWV